MGTVFRKQTTRSVPTGAEIVEKGGGRIARWRVRGKLRTAPLTQGSAGVDRIVTQSATYFAKYRDAGGKVVVRPTGCRDKQAAEQVLKRWEREGEQIKSGTLDRKALDAAKQAAVPLEEHLTAYEQSLIAADEKSRQGNAIALRDDHADDLRDWLSDKLVALQHETRGTGEPIPMRLQAGTSNR
ncbi:MAG TPA: hypothetical protein VM529_22750, partial [Gemmata sp.]|nr:hypothetical protein [Gemmata sp.]